MAVLSLVNFEESLMSKNTKFSCNCRPWDCLSYFRISWSKDNSECQQQILSRVLPSFSTSVDCWFWKRKLHRQEVRLSCSILVFLSGFNINWMLYFRVVVREGEARWDFFTFHDFINKWDRIYIGHRISDFIDEI